MQRNIIVDANQLVFLPVLEELDLSDNLLSADCLPAVSEALRALPELRVLHLQAPTRAPAHPAETTRSN